MSSVAVIGAGPYGLATVAYLRRAGVDAHVFGVPMESWETRMPVGMKLRSHQVASHIADPDRALGIEVWSAESGVEPGEPMDISEFIAYGKWFGEQVAPDVDRRRVQAISPNAGGFSVRLDDGEETSFAQVVVATGIAPFAQRPPEFEGLPDELVSHSADHATLDRFSGQSVLVLGAGQSALETAALLKEAGSEPRLVARVRDITWLPPHNQSGFKAKAAEVLLPPTDIGGPRSGWLAAAPDVWRRLSDAKRAGVFRHCTMPRGADWLRPRLAEVPLDVARNVSAVDANGAKVQVTLDDGSHHEVDHVILGTGYHVDVSRYGFLSDEALRGIETEGGAPRLGRGMESSLPGLYFSGAVAAPSFGPIMRFVVGTWYAAPAVSRSISGVRQRPQYFSYRPRGPRLRLNGSRRGAHATS